MNPIVVFSIEVKDPNTPSSTTVDITNVTIVNLVLMHDKQSAIMALKFLDHNLQQLAWPIQGQHNP